MLKSLLQRIVAHRHPWRYMKFDELAEIYTSMSLRSFGFGVIGIFVPLYLYKTGIDLQGVFWFSSWIFLLRMPVSVVAAYVVGRIGPKHSIAMSTLLFVLFLGLLLTFKTIGWPLILLAASFTVANGLFFIAYDTDFSKVKDRKNGGKELGWLVIFEKVGSALGPLIGGLLASFFAPEFTIVFAIIVLLGSLVPLFLTNEPVKVHQKISFKDFRFRRHVRDFVVMGAIGVDKVSSNMLWPLFIGVAIFVDNTYASIGGIIAIATIASVYSARMFGKFIDNNRGVHLLQYSSVVNALLYIVRPFTSTPVQALTVSAINEPVMLGYRMPIVKGLFDAADFEKGHRIVYLALIEAAGAFAKFIFCAVLYALCYRFDQLEVLRWSFIGVSLIAILPIIQRFPALKKV